MINFKAFNYLDKSKLYKISFTKNITLNPLTWLGGLIRLFANIEYNHTAVLYYFNDAWMIQEAINEGVKSSKFIDSNAYHYYTDYIIEEPIFNYNHNECLARLFMIEGKKYDFKGLLFYQLYLNLFNKWLGSAKKDGDRYYCYETVAYIFNINERKPKDINNKFKKK